MSKLTERVQKHCAGYVITSARAFPFGDVSHRQLVPYAFTNRLEPSQSGIAYLLQRLGKWTGPKYTPEQLTIRAQFYHGQLPVKQLDALFAKANNTGRVINPHFLTFETSSEYLSALEDAFREPHVILYKKQHNHPTGFFLIGPKEQSTELSDYFREHPSKIPSVLAQLAHASPDIISTEFAEKKIFMIRDTTKKPKDYMTFVNWAQQPQRSQQ